MTSQAGKQKMKIMAIISRSKDTEIWSDNEI